jgi:XRE family transcriptional regulator, regulator of sulfur utilization
VIKSTTQPHQQKTLKRRGTSFEPATAIAFGEVIRAERIKQEIAQDQFALLANVDRSYYGKLERGERQPSLALILRIAGGLGVAASDLIGRTELILKHE